MATSKKSSPVKKKAVAPKKAVLKGGNTETVVICDIRNLTLGKSIDIADIAKLTPQDAFSSKIKGEAIAAFGTVPSASDNIQVIWGVKTGSTFKTRFRGVGGSMIYDTASKKLSITGLKNVSRLSLGVSGVLDIGPKQKPGEDKEVVAHLNVSIGNLNKAGDWIINLSKKEEGGKGSYIRLSALLEWAKDKAQLNEDEAVELPKAGADDATATELDPEDFTILFNDLYVNLTSKTFKFDVESEDDKPITFGNFTINKVGFIVTNEPYLDDEDEDDEEDDEDAEVTD